MNPPNHLIIVCGHAIWNGGPKNGWDENEWLIESYKQGETPTFIEHIKAGVRALAEDHRAVLIFSGGPTRTETTLSEARSYHNLTIANSYFGLPPPLTHDAAAETTSLPRILLEERALDSYYNILFSLVEFWREYTVWPGRLTIVSHAFKRTRLVEGHCVAIGFPLDRVDFIGINPPGVEEMFGLGVQTKEGRGGGSGGILQEKAEAMQGVQLAIGQWADDPHGVGEELAGKRRSRNCWGVHQRLFFTDEERVRSGVATRLLEDGGEVLVYDGGVRPWAKVDDANAA